MLVHYFTAPWCGPCKTFGPALEAFAQKNQVEVIKHNVEEEHDLVKEYGIMSVPTTIWFDDAGRLIVFKTGALTERLMQEYLAQR